MFIYPVIFATVLAFFLAFTSRKTKDHRFNVTVYVNNGTSTYILTCDEKPIGYYMSTINIHVDSVCFHRIPENIDYDSLGEVEQQVPMREEELNLDESVEVCLRDMDK